MSQRETVGKYRVTAQSNGGQHRGRKPRWAYVLDTPGEWPYVSEYRFASEAAAMTRGIQDAQDAIAFEAQHGGDDEQ
jgi:hypothetical protein